MSQLLNQSGWFCFSGEACFTSAALLVRHTHLPPLQWCLIVYEHLWPMTFVITVTSVRFYAAKILSVSTIAFSSVQAGVRWHHLPCDQWVRIHTDRLGHLVLQSVKTAFVEHSIPHQSHWWAGPRTPRNLPPLSPLRLAPAKAWPCREGRGHLAADATHWYLQLYRPSP